MHFTKADATKVKATDQDRAELWLIARGFRAAPRGTRAKAGVTVAYVVGF
jgi:hypothetical protein